jgi:anti-anti-sigma factor
MLDARDSTFSNQDSRSMSSNVKVFEPSGLLDATVSDSLRKEIATTLEEGTQIVLIDLKNVSFLDSSGLGALVRALKLVRLAKAELYLCSLSDQAMLLFEITCMDRTFNILPDHLTFERDVLNANGVS